MNTQSIIHAFEIDVCSLNRTMPVIAVGQSLNTLFSGDVLRINACSKSTAALLSTYCANTGHTVLQQVEVDSDVTMYVRKI